MPVLGRFDGAGPEVGVTPPCFLKLSTRLFPNGRGAGSEGPRRFILQSSIDGAFDDVALRRISDEIEWIASHHGERGESAI